MKSIKISEYFKVIKPEYVFVKLKPNNSIRNQSTHNLARSISSLYRSVYRNIKKEDEKVLNVLGRDFGIPTKYSYQMPSKVSYYIFIEKKKVEFYFIVPKHHYTIIKEKIGDVWKNITIDEVKEIPQFSEKSLKYQMVYAKEDGLSLNSDRKSNDLLHSNLNIVDVLEEGDKVGIFYNFIPSHQENIRNSYLHTIERVKKGMPVDRNKWGIGYALKLALGFVDSLIQDVSDVLSGGNEKKQNESVLEGIVDRLNGGSKTKPSTDRKRKAIYLPTQILIMSESASKVRQRNNAFSLAQSFDVISEDNRLIHKRLNKKKLDLTDYNIGAEINNVGDEEAQNFIAMPGRDVLETHNFIDKVETQETEVPEDLREGVIRLGESTYRGHKQQAYLSTDTEYRMLSTVLVGPTRAGKSTLIANMTHDALHANESVILFDYIGNCELSDEVSALFPKEKVLNIECDDFETIQGLGYNEVPFSDDENTRYVNAKKQTTQLKTLVNSINTEDTPLSARMNRFLTAAALTVFISNGSIKDVFGVLQNSKTRARYIKKVPTSQFENMEEYIGYLAELDKEGSDGEVTTRLNLVEGIISRLNALKDNPYLEMMLKKETTNNIDLVEEMQKPQLIVLKMPESMFNTDNERDIYTTYWITKLWLALQIRKTKFKNDRSKLTKCNLVIDELYQVENTEIFLTKKLNRLAKFNLKPIISCHHIEQLKHMKKTELKSANASYMLIAGCDKKNYQELAEELRPFELGDLLNMKRYHSMNLIKNKTGYGRFITHLPPPVSENKKEEVATDDIYINGVSFAEVAATKEK